MVTRLTKMLIFISDFQLELPICWAARVTGHSRKKSIRYGSPSCDKDGYFAPLQCQPSLGCFCFDKYGNVTIQPSRNRSSIPDCRNLTHDAKSLTTKQNIILPTIQVQPTTNGKNAFHYSRIIFDRA